MKRPKIKYEQRIGYEKIIICAIIGREVIETFYIKGVDQETGIRYNGFAVTSDKGLDTFGNRLVFSTLEKSIAYIKYCVVNSDHYLYSVVK